MTTTAATGQEKFKKYYTPHTPGFSHVPINDFVALQNAVTPYTCAIIIEPIQGESGVNAVTKEYLQKIRKLCDEKDILLIFDEIQCGFGRCGTLFAYQYFEVEPDIFTLAKGLAGGVPIGALLAKDFVAKAFEPADHGSTFGGNPLACATALSVLNTVLNEDLPEKARVMGEYFSDKLNHLKLKYTQITEIRGLGLMIGIELKDDIAVEMKNKFFEKGYLIGSVGTNVLRLLPPLILTKHDIDGFIDTFDDILKIP
jgi:acetylornithine aminotransferase/acetylornithine/N-succinyldiaminopimelate aminotransferase